MASTIQERYIKKLQEAGYLAKKTGHQLPPAGQIVPTPEPHERVVCIPHFVRGLEFPLHQLFTASCIITGFSSIRVWVAQLHH